MAEEVWMLQTKKADFKQIGARFRIDPVTARIIRNRGIEGEAAIDRYLNGTLDDLMILTASVRRTYYCRHLNGWAVM